MAADTIVNEHIQKILPLLKNIETGNVLPHPWVRPTHGVHYSNILYCWDHHHMGMRFASADMPQYLRFLPENLLHHQTHSGFTPSMVHRDSGPIENVRAHAQPFLCQSAFLYVHQTADLPWAKRYLPKLLRYVHYYESNQQTDGGLFRWPMPWLSGIDNDVATSFLPSGTVVSADINAWVYLEYLAAAQLATHAGDNAFGKECARKAEVLRAAVNAQLWDDDAGTYAALDLRTGRRVLHYEDTNIGEYGRFAYGTAGTGPADD